MEKEKIGLFWIGKFLIGVTFRKRDETMRHVVIKTCFSINSKILNDFRWTLLNREWKKRSFGFKMGIIFVAFSDSTSNKV